MDRYTLTVVSDEDAPEYTATEDDLLERIAAILGERDGYAQIEFERFTMCGVKGRNTFGTELACTLRAGHPEYSWGHEHTDDGTTYALETK